MLGKFVFQRSQNSCFLLTVSLPRSAVKIESSQKFTVPAVAIKNTHRNDPPCNIFAEYYKKFCSFFLNDMARHAPPCLCGKSLEVSVGMGNFIRGSWNLQEGGVF